MIIERMIYFLVNQYYDLQKLRIEAFNRIVAFCGGKDFIKKYGKEKPSIIAKKLIEGKVSTNKDIGDLIWYYNCLWETEKQLAKRLNSWSSTHPLRINWLSKIKGIGPILSSAIIAWIEPIDRFENISKLWAYSGLSSVHYESVCNGKKKHHLLTTHAIVKCPIRVGKSRKPCNASVTSEFIKSPIKRRRGWIMCINPKMKTLMWKVASSFEKQKPENSRYNRIYAEIKAKYAARPDLKKAVDNKEKSAKMHIRLMAMRYVAKRFLADTWLVWRAQENLSITTPYSIGVLGHTGYEPPQTDEVNGGEKKKKRKKKET